MIQGTYTRWSRYSAGQGLADMMRIELIVPIYDRYSLLKLIEELMAIRDEMEAGSART